MQIYKQQRYENNQRKNMLTVNKVRQVNGVTHTSYLIVSDKFQVVNLHRRIEGSSIIRNVNGFQVRFQCLVVYIIKHFDIYIN